MAGHEPIEPTEPFSSSPLPARIVRVDVCRVALEEIRGLVQGRMELDLTTLCQLRIIVDAALDSGCDR
jgi:hypothetical protein